MPGRSARGLRRPYSGLPARPCWWGRLSTTRAYCQPRRTATRAEAAALFRRFALYLEGLGRQEPQPPQPQKHTRDLMEGYAAQPVTVPEDALTARAEQAAEFSVKLFQNTVRSGENLLLSPISVLYAMGMVANGAAGETRAQIEEAFGMTSQQANEFLYAFTQRLTQGQGAVRTANSIWLRNGLDVKSQFLQTNADYYGADAYQSAFDGQTVDEINRWASQQTDGMIPRAVNGLTPNDVLCLINTVLFQARWEQPYEGASQMPFTCADGSVQTAQMLCGTEHVYLKDDGVSGFLKAFQGGKYAFAVLVPDAGVPLDDYLASLTGQRLRQVLKGELYDAVYTAMPRFEATAEVSVEAALRAMGVTDAFSQQQADFSGLSGGVYLSAVTQNGKIEVDENGVSAAAATTVIEAGAAEPVKTATVTADRPYIYMIVELSARLPLFMGTVNRVG